MIRNKEFQKSTLKLSPSPELASPSPTFKVSLLTCKYQRMQNYHKIFLCI